MVVVIVVVVVIFRFILICVECEHSGHQHRVKNDRHADNNAELVPLSVSMGCHLRALVTTRVRDDNEGVEKENRRNPHPKAVHINQIYPKVQETIRNEIRRAVYPLGTESHPATVEFYVDRI